MQNRQNYKPSSSSSIHECKPGSLDNTKLHRKMAKPRNLFSSYVKEEEEDNQKWKNEGKYSALTEEEGQENHIEMITKKMKSGGSFDDTDKIFNISTLLFIAITVIFVIIMNERDATDIVVKSLAVLFVIIIIMYIIIVYERTWRKWENKKRLNYYNNEDEFEYYTDDDDDKVQVYKSVCAEVFEKLFVLLVLINAVLLIWSWSAGYLPFENVHKNDY